MTDRDCEMVKNAALAAGYRWRGFSGYQPLLEEDPSKPEPRLACPHNWNPLTDDGDAFRLMVKLGLFGSPEVAHHRTLAHIFENCPDDSAVYRRAITRAAAAIQEAKEGV